MANDAVDRRVQILHQLHGGYRQVKRQMECHLKVPLPQPHHVTLCARNVSRSNVSLTFPSMWYLSFVQSLVFLLGPHTQGGPRTFESQPVLIMTRPVLTAVSTTTCKQPQTKMTGTRTHRLKIITSSYNMFEVLMSAPSTIKLFNCLKKSKETSQNLACLLLF